MEALLNRRGKCLRRPCDGVPVGCRGMIVLVAAIECFVSRNWLDFTDPVSLSWRYSASSVTTESPGCDLLCLGDSLIKHGLLPGVIEEETGRRTLNLSAARAPALLTYFFLRRALDAGARPRAIIINAKPAVLLAGPDSTRGTGRKCSRPANASSSRSSLAMVRSFWRRSWAGSCHRCARGWRFDHR